MKEHLFKICDTYEKKMSNLFGLGEQYAFFGKESFIDIKYALQNPLRYKTLSHTGKVTHNDEPQKIFSGDIISIRCDDGEGRTLYKTIWDHEYDEYVFENCCKERLRYEEIKSGYFPMEIIGNFYLNPEIWEKEFNNA